MDDIKFWNLVQSVNWHKDRDEVRVRSMIKSWNHVLRAQFDEILFEKVVHLSERVASSLLDTDEIVAEIIAEGFRSYTNATKRSFLQACHKYKKEPSRFLFISDVEDV